MDAATIASLATAGGTLILAVATFGSTRSANRAARVSERAFQAAQRPVLFNARQEDPVQKVSFIDDQWLVLENGRAAIRAGDEAIYMAMPLRNVAAGIAVLHGWQVRPGRLTVEVGHGPPEEFRRLTRDLYVPAGDIGFWQGALRDRSDPTFDEVREAAHTGTPLTVDLLYDDHEGGQRTISRFALTSIPSADGTPSGKWACFVALHWNLDRADPR